MMPENGAEKIHFVLGNTCVQVFEWNEHYIKDNGINDVTVFDVSSQKYFDWEHFVYFANDIAPVDTLFETGINQEQEEKARKALRRLRFKVFKPIGTIPMKKALKTKKKIENKFVCTPSSK